jgi:hypothetical protein
MTPTPVADPDGEILVTDAVREAVTAVKDRLANHGRHELKQLPLPGNALCAPFRA